MNNVVDSSVINIWNNFIVNHPEFKGKSIPNSWHFCNEEKDANECAQLVIQGVKKATSPFLWWFEKTNQTLPKIGDLNIVTDWNGLAKAIIETTQVDQLPFNQITDYHAKIEGEGDQSLAFWKMVHWDYYTREMAPFGETPTQEMIIVFEQFKTVFTRES